MRYLNISAARAFILVSNVVLLGLFAKAGWGFLLSTPNELETATPKFSKMEIKVDKRGRNTRLDRTVMETIERKEPPPPVEKVKKPPPSAEKVKPGGPLSDWKILNFAVLDDSRVAFVERSGAGNTPEPAATKTRGRGSRAARNRTRGRGRTRSTRGANQISRNVMIEGEIFKNTDYLITRVDILEVEYMDENSGKSFVLRREGYDPRDFTAGLDGKLIEEIGDLPRAPVETPAEPKAGSIQNGPDAKKTGPKKADEEKRAADAKANAKKEDD